MLYFLPKFLNWAVFWRRRLPTPTPVAPRRRCLLGCDQEKYRLILFGRYPFDEQWRPLIATLLMVALVVASCTRVLEQVARGVVDRRHRRTLS